MTKDQHFTFSMRRFQDMPPQDLDIFCTALLPDMQFRFATFENDDYRNGNVTCCLYSAVPESVFLSVETPLEIDPALEKLVKLNPGVEWYWVQLKYIDYDESGHARVLIELRLSDIPMRVTAVGKLVCK